MSKIDIRQFTDTDLDGTGCFIVLNQFYKVDCTSHAPGTVDYAVWSYIQSLEHMEEDDIPDYIVISDLSIHDRALADELFSYTFDKYGVQVVLLDHHASALWLNKYGARVCVKLNGKLTCGTELVYEWCLENFKASRPDLSDSLAKLVEVVRLWDTWDWTLPSTDLHLKYLAEGLDLCVHYFDTAQLCSRITFNLLQGELVDPDLDQYMNILVDIKHHEIEDRLKFIHEADFCGYTAGIVFSDKYESDIGNELCKKGYQVGIVIDMYHNTVSLRSIDEDVDVSNIAVMYNGGGHLHAAGFPLNYGDGEDGVTDTIIEHLLDMQAD